MSNQVTFSKPLLEHKHVTAHVHLPRQQRRFFYDYTCLQLGFFFPHCCNKSTTSLLLTNTCGQIKSTKNYSYPTYIKFQNCKSASFNSFLISMTLTSKEKKKANQVLNPVCFCSVSSSKDYPQPQQELPGNSFP